ncbi:MAG: dioxygenase [Planctomycetota bacterium]|nr:MAG: dioxygenase [Planctomycetota bacterium]
METQEKAFIEEVARRDSKGIVKGLEDDGCVLIPNLVDKSKVAEMKNEIDQLIHHEHDNNAINKTNDHFKCVFNRSPYWLQFIDMDGIIDGIEELMGHDCHIIGMSAWRSPPGIGRKYFHIDQLMMPMDSELLLNGHIKLPVYYSTLHFYLSDIDEDLCPTYIVPGSHKSGRAPGHELEKNSETGFLGGDEDSWNGVKARPLLVNAGDGLLFRSEVWHGGSKNNTTDRTRYLLQVHYGRRGVAQRFPPYLEFQYNKDVLDQATDRQLRLLGKHPIGAYG